MWCVCVRGRGGRKSAGVSLVWREEGAMKTVGKGDVETRVTGVKEAIRLSIPPLGLLKVR